MKEIQMKKINCINLYRRNKRIARNRKTYKILVFQTLQVPSLNYEKNCSKKKHKSFLRLRLEFCIT